MKNNKNKHKIYRMWSRLLGIWAMVGIWQRVMIISWLRCWCRKLRRRNKWKKRRDKHSRRVMMDLLLLFKDLILPLCTQILIRIRVHIPPILWLFLRPTLSQPAPIIMQTCPWTQTQTLTHTQTPVTVNQTHFQK